jgi:uncharacterized protein involved in exopolysaccharide biosynthesis
MSGNGVDSQAMYDLIVHMSAEIARLSASMGQQFAEVKRDIRSLQQGQSSVRAELAQYHASVMGHGILITELDERVSRIERRLDRLTESSPPP